MFPEYLVVVVVVVIIVVVLWGFKIIDRRKAGLADEQPVNFHISDTKQNFLSYRWAMVCKLKKKIYIYILIRLFYSVAENKANELGL